MDLIEKLSNLYKEYEALLEPCKNGLGWEENKEHWDKVVEWLEKEYSLAMDSDDEYRINVITTLEVMIRGYNIWTGRNSGLETENSPLYKIYSKILTERRKD